MTCGLWKRCCASLFYHLPGSNRERLECPAAFKGMAEGSTSTHQYLPDSIQDTEMIKGKYNSNNSIEQKFLFI